MTVGVEPTFFYVCALLFGLTVGSFLNVVIHRLPLGASVVRPGSHCPSCQTPIAPWDNIPVLSYVLLGGRCRHCRAHISLRYPAVELMTGLVFAALAWRFGPTWMALFMMLFAAALIVAAGVDIDHQIIPDEISIGGLVAGLLVAPLVHAAAGTPYILAVKESLLGALIGAGMLWVPGFLHARYCVLRGRTFDHWPGEGESIPRPSEADYWLWFPGMGLGDVKLLAMIGAFLGVWGAIYTVLAASIAGALLGLGWAAVKRTFDAPFGLAPAIALGAFLSLFLPSAPPTLF